jgi:hypothetical protein
MRSHQWLIRSQACPLPTRSRLLHLKLHLKIKDYKINLSIDTFVSLINRQCISRVVSITIRYTSSMIFSEVIPD